jgi:hypothetical protein
LSVSPRGVILGRHAPEDSVIRSILSMIVLVAISAAALAQLPPVAPGGSQPGNRRPDLFGPSPQAQPYPQQPQYPQYPQQPRYPQQPYSYPMQGQVSLVGVWSTTLHDTQGRAIASIFVQFSPDGSYHKRMLVPAGQSDVFGIWQYDAQNAVLHSQARDYAPKSLPPSEAMGQSYALRLQWVSTNHFIAQDASGPIRWVRQQ